MPSMCAVEVGLSMPTVDLRVAGVPVMVFDRVCVDQTARRNRLISS
jgi:hypothetical protein